MMDFDLVLLSPLRRAQMTAYHLLKDHPRFSTIEFVLVPFCREHLNWGSDVPLPYSASAELAKSLFPTVDTTTHFSQFDESDGTREAYFLEHIDEQPRS